MSPIIVFDLDGTLALDDHRIGHLRSEPRDWDAYFSRCHLDSPNPAIIALYNDLSIYHHVEIWSGRREDTRAKTTNWLLEHCWVPPVRLLLRPIGDRQSNVELKRKWLYELRASGGDLSLVFEDLPDVVAMWRSEGICCCQVAEGTRI